MKHGKKFNHLGRKSAHRKATLMNLANSLIVHKRIKTTVAKAKALRQYVEPLITKSKDDTTHSRRVVFSYLRDKEAVTELFREVSQKVMNRQGGYTRIIKLEPRLGDNAELCYIELVDYNENLLSEKTKRKTTRRRRKSAAKKATEPVAKTSEETADETTVEEKIEDKTPEAEEVTEVKEENTAEKKTPEPEDKKEKQPEDKKEESPAEESKDDKSTEEKE
jgi:large subunit ribosomal protein L17